MLAPASTVNALLFVPELAMTASHPAWSWARIIAAAGAG
jgi:hypothetical protein